MVNGKPTLTFGDGQLPSAAQTRRAGGRRSLSGAAALNQPGGFASFLPAAEKAGPQQAGAHKAPAAGDFSSFQFSGHSLAGLGGREGAVSGEGLAAAPRSSGTKTDDGSSGGAGALSGSRAAAARGYALPGGKKSRTAARADAQAMAEALPAKGAARKAAGGPKARISDRPVTGRGGIGMEDTRLTRGRSTLAPRSETANIAANALTVRGGMGGQNFSGRPVSYAMHGNEFAQGQLGGMDLSGARNAATLAKVLEAGSTPLKTLQPLPAGTTFGSVRDVRFPGMQEGAETAARAAGHRRQGGAAPLLESPLLSSGATKDLIHTFRKLAGAGERPIGALAAKFESGAEGISAIGYDRHGGTSYGKYQISSRAGTMKNFIAYLQDKAPDLAGRLESAGPANTGSRRGRMPAEWKKIAEEQPKRFETLQGDFIRSSHFEPAMQAIEESTGVAFKSMPPALQEVLFSTAVQHGPAGAARIISRAVSEVGAGKLQLHDGKTPETFKRTGRALIKQIYAIRAGQFVSSSARVQASVQNRLTQEMHEALSMLA